MTKLYHKKYENANFILDFLQKISYNIYIINNKGNNCTMTELYNFSFEFCACGAESSTKENTPLLCNGIVAGADYADAVANIVGTFRSDKNKISKLLVEEVGSSAVLIGNPKPVTNQDSNPTEQNSTDETANNE